VFVKRRNRAVPAREPRDLLPLRPAVLHSLLALADDERPDPARDDQRRRYYSITEFGRRVAGAEAERLSGLVEKASTRKLLRCCGPSVPKGI
jgi:hypothetical protein